MSDGVENADMSFDLTEQDADHLLSGVLDDGSAMSSLFAAMRSPGEAHELAGSRAVLTDFLAAVRPGADDRQPALVDVSRGRKAGRRVCTTARVATLASAALLSVGGIAAAGGHLPGPVQRTVSNAVSVVGLHVPSPGRANPDTADSAADRQDSSTVASSTVTSSTVDSGTVHSSTVDSSTVHSSTVDSSFGDANANATTGHSPATTTADSADNAGTSSTVEGSETLSTTGSPANPTVSQDGTGSTSVADVGPSDPMCARYRQEQMPAGRALDAATAKVLTDAAARAGTTVDALCATGANASVPGGGGGAPGQSGHTPSTTTPAGTGENPDTTAPDQNPAAPTTGPGEVVDDTVLSAPAQPGDMSSNTAPGQSGDTSAVTAPGHTGDNPSITAPGHVAAENGDA